MPESDEKRAGWNKRQIDEIDRKTTDILKILNGNGKIGLTGKVDIMWGYRNIFVGLFSVNLITIIVLIIEMFNIKF